MNDGITPQPIEPGSERTSTAPTPSRARRCLRALLKGIARLALVLVALWAYLTWANRPVHITLPLPTLPSPNGFTELGRVAQNIPLSNGDSSRWYLDGPVSSPRPGSTWPPSAYARFMQANKPVLDAARSKLTLPSCAPTQRSFASPVPCYARFRELGRRFASEAEYYRARGQFSKAVNSGLDCMNLGTIVPQRGVVYPYIVGNCIESIGLSEAIPLLPRLSGPELGQVAARLEKMCAGRVEISSVITEEGYFDVAAWQEILDNVPVWQRPIACFLLLQDLGRTGEDGPSKSDLLKFPFQDKRNLLLRNLRWYAALAEEARQPYRGASRIPSPHNLIADQTEASLFDDVRKLAANQDAIWEVMRAEVAVRRYRADAGRYPEGLNQLVPRYLKSVPTDPCGQGKPLMYRLLKGGREFLLYSVGPDLKDDHGKPRAKRWGPGDIVAGKTRF